MATPVELMKNAIRIRRGLQVPVSGLIAQHRLDLLENLQRQDPADASAIESQDLARSLLGVPIVQRSPETHGVTPILAP